MSTSHKEEKMSLNLQYDIAWEIGENALEIDMENLILLMASILDQMNETEAYYHVFLEHNVQIEAGKLILSVKVNKQLNVNKWYKFLTRQILARVKNEDDHKAEGILWQKQAQILSYGNLPANEDERLRGLIQGIKEVYYYDLDEGMVTEDIQKFKAYLLKRKLGLIETEEHIVLVDEAMLQKKINLNCFECTRKYQYGCCAGTPCAMSEKNGGLLDQHLMNLEELLRDIDAQQYATLIEKGGFLTANGKIKAIDGHCSLLIQHDGVYKCIAHKYALEQKIPPYDLCPLSCLMYPLEIMELVTEKRKTLILVTAAVEEEFAEAFSRWGSYKSLETSLECVNEEFSDEIFKKEEYRPIYEVNEKLLIHEFEKSLVLGIKRMFEK